MSCFFLYNPKISEIQYQVYCCMLYLQFLFVTNYIAVSTCMHCFAPFGPTGWSPSNYEALIALCVPSRLQGRSDPTLIILPRRIKIAWSELDHQCVPSYAYCLLIAFGRPFPKIAGSWSPFLALWDQWGVQWERFIHTVCANHANGGIRPSVTHTVCANCDKPDCHTHWVC